MDRYRELARRIVEYSLDVACGELVWIESWDGETRLTYALVQAVLERGATPKVARCEHTLQRRLIGSLTPEGAAKLGRMAYEDMKQVDSFVSVRAAENPYEESDIPAAQAVRYRLAMQDANHQRMFRAKWCVLRAPGASMAQSCGMSTEAFEAYYWQNCLVDYEKMTRLAKPLAEDMARVDQVRILAPDTDVRFSIKGSKGVSPFLNDTGCGRLNIPDGEIGGGVVKESAEGYITYNIPSTYRDTTFERVRFAFRKGRIVEASCSRPALQAAMDAILDTDAGARYLCEFSLGIHPLATRPIGDTLFDEKMWGSFHLTPGADQSAVHWDLVQSQREEDGGGELYWDGKLVRKNGLFLPEAYQPLNPSRLTPEIAIEGGASA